MKRLETCRRLLKRVSLIAWRYDVGGPDAFNIFTVLRSESDEANLHTRFLAALLDHRKTGDIHRRNLEDFLVQVARIDGFGLAGAVVEREAVVKEYDRIDILISNKDRKQAVVIENKIEAGDQPQQLKKYAKQLQEKGYSVPSLLYLTLDGHGPSEDSRGGHKVNCISYKKNLMPWLQRCQERAYDEPELRETISQYIALVRKLTGTDIRGRHMMELRDLILKGENLALVHDLSEAMLDAKVVLLRRLWEDIDDALQRIEGFPKRDDRIEDMPLGGRTDISQQTLRKHFTSGGVWSHLLYEFGDGLSLAVEIGAKRTRTNMYYGVKCHKASHPVEYDRLQQKLQNAFGDDIWHEPGWPWIRGASENPDLQDLRNTSRNCLLFLNDETRRRGFADEIATKMRLVWDTVENFR